MRDAAGEGHIHPMLSPVLAFALTALIIEITPGPNMT
jgi:hypothetical protein